MYLSELKALAIGDEVGVARTINHGRKIYIGKVTKVTKRIIVIDGNLKFSRQTGRAWGHSDSWFGPTLIAAKNAREQNREIVKRQKLHSMRDNIITELQLCENMETLEAIRNLLPNGKE